MMSRSLGRAIFTAALLVSLMLVSGSARAEQRIERGEYLAVRVAQCVQCHTPRDEYGNLLTSRLFEGARIPVTNPFPGPKWATQSPALAGLAAVRRDDVISILTMGTRVDGRIPRSPMPQFRMTREDAEAIADYLQSLPAPMR